MGVGPLVVSKKFAWLAQAVIRWVGCWIIESPCLPAEVFRDLYITFTLLVKVKVRLRWPLRRQESVGRQVVTSVPSPKIFWVNDFLLTVRVVDICKSFIPTVSQSISYSVSHWTFVLESLLLLFRLHSHKIYNSKGSKQRWPRSQMFSDQPN